MIFISMNSLLLIVILQIKSVQIFLDYFSNYLFYNIKEMGFVSCTASGLNRVARFFFI